MIKPGSTYAIAHKGYIRQLALYHPDKIVAQVYDTIPTKPKSSSFFSKDSFSEKLSQYEK
jgi:hypothetical protein